MELDRFEWLAGRVEEAVDAQQRIVDPHHHLWNRGGSTYLAPELLADTGATHNVTQTVFVECMSKYNRDAPEPLQPVGETVFVAAEAAKMREGVGATIEGIVGFADLALGDAVEEVLRAHEEAAGGLFRGVRHGTAWSSDPTIGIAHTNPPEGLLGDPTFRAGAAKLASMGHSFDAWLFHPQLDELVAFARALPELSIVLDHLGAPLGVGEYAGADDEVRRVWAASLAELATCSNVTLKIGGIGMDNYFGTGWTADEIPPSSEAVAAHWGDRIRWCIDTFGPGRCMFESNFPVDRQSLTYAVVWNAFQRIVADHFDQAERDDLFWRSASRVYRLAN